MTNVPEQSPSGTDLPKSYTPSGSEGEIRARWNAASAFHADPGAPGEPFCLLIPPPNVTAALHLGHAFNNTLQDVLARYHRMRGFNTLWMPGTDHAGIATQTVVEKRLLLQGRKRTDFSRDEFIARVQEWKDEYEATIIEQLQAMGCSCDFDRTRFTMDEVCAKAVREAFFRLFKDGLIYRGKRLVNWDPVSQTALADDEVEMEEVQGHMWYLRYPLVDAHGSRSVGFVTVATTRPETMLGDTAVAINPKDPRAAQLVGKSVRLPIVNRIIPIIADDYVVMPVQYGGDPADAKAAIATGFLKVTPAHDPNDYEIGQRHSLPIINVFAPDASVSDKHGWTDASDEAKQFIGLSSEAARKKIVEWFKDHGLLEDAKPYTHSVGHSYRSHVPIEPYLSDQWYVKVTDDRLKGEALRAMAQYEVNPGIAPATGSAGVSPADSDAYGGRGVGPELTIHKRSKLPHWQLGGSTYYITFNVDNEAAPLSEEERKIVLDACFHWHVRRMHVHIATVMPDHVHLIITPLERQNNLWWALSDLIQSIRSFTAHEILRRRGRQGTLWQSDYFDRIIRSESDYLEKWNYVAENAVRAGIVARAEDYPYTRVTAFETRAGETPALPKSGSAAVSAALETGTDETRAGETPALPKPGDGELRFHPARYAKTFQQWHENLRDWCISRQLWWGHRIPVWSTPVMGGFSPDFEQFQSLLAKWIHEERIAVFGRHRFGPEHDDPTETYDTTFICIRNQFDEEVLNQLESRGFSQDPDVLDTWFSSGLWPLSTMGWPDPEAFPNEIPEGSALLNTFNPSTTLCTAREIITLWVSRMVMFNRYLRDGKLPFKNVYIHAMIQDGHGQKMSKSLGNGVDPRDIIHTHGADAMRFVLTQIATATQDVRLPVDTMCPHPGCEHTFHPREIISPAGYKVAAPEQTCPNCKKKMISSYGAASGQAQPSAEAPLARNSSSRFDQGRNFANKLWNATRFALSNLSAAGAHGWQSVAVEQLALVDKWILARLHRTLHAVEDAIADYQFNAYADAMYDLVWRDFCDWYLEAIKPTVKSNPVQQQVLRTVLNAIMRLLHPIMPFVTETLWPHVNACGLAGLEGVVLPPNDLLAHAAWPDIKCAVENRDAVAVFERLQTLVESIRTIKTERHAQKKRIQLLATPAALELIESGEGVVESLAGIERIYLVPPERPAGAIPLAFEGAELLLVGLVEQMDAATEIARLTKLIAEKEKAAAGFRGRLENPGYISKAPREKVEETQSLLSRTEADLVAARKALESLR